jgi:hypothetical protein
MPRPCHALTMPFFSKSNGKDIINPYRHGMAGERHGRRMLCVNRPLLWQRPIKPLEDTIRSRQHIFRSPNVQHTIIPFAWLHLAQHTASAKSHICWTHATKQSYKWYCCNWRDHYGAVIYFSDRPVHIALIWYGFLILSFCRCK